MKVTNQAPTTYVTALFDTLTESKLLWMRKQLKTYTGKNVPKYRPHITLYGCNLETKPVYDIVWNQLKLCDFKPFKVPLRNISNFPTVRVMSIPVEVPYLRAVQSQMDHNLRAVQSSPQFFPANWKPHVTMIKDLQNRRQRNDAAACISEKWEPILGAQVVAIGIMQQGKGRDDFVIDLERS